jgi:hypothetical protein
VLRYDPSFESLYNLKINKKFMRKLLLGALILSAVSVSAQTVARKTLLVKGQQLEQQNQINMNITQEMGGQTMEIKMESSFNSLIDTKDETAAGYSVATTLKKVLMNMNAMGQEMTFDSDKKEDMDGQMGAAYKDKIGKTKEYTVSKNGIITEVKTKETPEDEQSGMMGGMMSGGMDQEKEGANFHAFANIPAKGIKVGDTWSDSTHDGGSRSLTTYTLKQVNGDEGTVSLTGDLTISREIQQQGTTMQMEMTGTTTGEYTFDVKTGLIKSRKATTKTTGTVDVMGQSIPMTMETNLVSTTVKK